jgi:hypothetical protein
VVVIGYSIATHDFGLDGMAEVSRFSPVMPLALKIYFG